MHNICISTPSNSLWVHQWLICSPIPMSSRYWISKHHLRYANNSNNNVGSVKLRLRFLIVETPPDPLPNFVVDPISTPLLTTSMLSAVTVSTLWLLYLHWVIEELLFQHVVSGSQQLSLLTLLVKLFWLEIDIVLVCGYPLVSFVVQYVDVNTPLVLCPKFE